MVLQRTERRRRPPILVEPAYPIGDLSPAVKLVLEAARAWDADPDRFGSGLNPPRRGWVDLFATIGRSGLAPRHPLSLLIDETELRLQ